MKIPFHKKHITTKEIELTRQYYQGVSLDAKNKTEKYFSNQFKLSDFFLTKSCTQSLELAIMSLGIRDGMEVILPSYAFISLANAVVINRLKCVFVDCEPDTMNICPDAIQSAITDKTVAIITINYGGVSCNYQKIKKICQDHHLYLIEDNAHGIHAKYNGKHLGSFGDISTFSFDYLKNISCNEGGGIAINKKSLLNNFMVHYHFGTNKQAFINREVDFYEWKGVGMNCNLAVPLIVSLLGQLDHSVEIMEKYISMWNFYYSELSVLEEEGKIRLAKIPKYVSHNAHFFWIKTQGLKEKLQLISYLQKYEIGTASHYTPLHTSEFGMKCGRFSGEEVHTTNESNCLLRLPLYYDLSLSEQEYVIEKIVSFYKL